MKKENIHRIFITTFIIVCFSFIKVLGADHLYRFMHNDQDALVIGEIRHVDEDIITVNVSKQITSSKDLNTPPIKQSSIPDKIKIEDVEKYALFYGSTSSDARPKKGDYVLASINKKGKNFKWAWGVYKIDSTDHKSLNILSAKNDYGAKKEAVAIKTFINSDGKATEFTFDSSKVYCDGEVIYDSSKDKSLISNGEENSEVDSTSKEEVDKGNIIFGIKEELIMFVVCVGIMMGGVYYFRQKKKM